MKKIPTPQDWINYYQFKKKIAIDLIIEKAITDSNYYELVEKTKKSLDLTYKTIEDYNKVYEQLKKSLKNKI